MSELDKPPDAFEWTDISDQFTDRQDWMRFVPRVLKVTIDGYRLLNQQQISRWDEDTFRINLVNKMLKDKYAHLTSEYVIEGMVRFLDEHWKYSSEVDDAGMLGFVLCGEATKIVEAVNIAMLNPPSLIRGSKVDQRRLWALYRAQTLSQADQLKVCNPSPIEDFVVYQSKHRRDFCGRAIRLYHLFLIFDYNDT